MASVAIKSQIQDRTLHLSGVLDCDTLNSIWQNQIELLPTISNIDVSQLERVDSSGLAMLVYLCLKQKAKLNGITPQLKMLIELYDLDTVVV